MIKLHQLDNRLTFPAIDHALDEPNGLLAFGGDLSIERLELAYRHGIFPWFSDGEPILWWSPNPRGVMALDDFHCSKSLLKFARTTQLSVTLNHAFSSVIDACASMPRRDDGTWITPLMQDAYKNLHLCGLAHSVEVWDQTELVGGLYGVAVGGVFCGESMFSHVSNASKLAYFYLVEHLKSIGADFIDCQMQNAHLQRLGCREVSREEFLRMLAKSRNTPITKKSWQAQILSA